MGGVVTVFRWELSKLAAQKRTYLGIGAAILVLSAAPVSADEPSVGDSASGADPTTQR